jgi:NRAMP (natural resistance-associated macrophage protein)-like metal ion transporter
VKSRYNINGIKKYLGVLGPGLITGAADDDPSGIATYSQAGAQFGFGLLWSVFLTLPLMIVIQEISARIGRVTGRGISANLRKYYPAWVLYPAVFLLIIANTINIGADIGAMGDALSLVIGGHAFVYTLCFALLTIGLQVFTTYATYSKYLKWLTLMVLSYVVTMFAVHVPWKNAILNTIFPSISLNGDYFATLIAVLGTTISPYLFFWQASQETEEMKDNEHEDPLLHKPDQAGEQLQRIRIDTITGMLLSNFVAYAIIVTAASTLNINGITDVQSSAQAAEALRPLAGELAFIIFAIGIIGTGLLAVPVLAGSAAYAIGEALKWPTGLARKPLDAKGFYSVIVASTLIGTLINFVGINPIKALFWSAVINGIVAVPIMIMMMLMVQNIKVMGWFIVTSRPLLTVGWIATGLMTIACIGLFVTSL